MSTLTITQNNTATRGNLGRSPSALAVAVSRRIHCQQQGPAAFIFLIRKGSTNGNKTEKAAAAMLRQGLYECRNLWARVVRTVLLHGSIFNPHRQDHMGGIGKDGAGKTQASRLHQPAFRCVHKADDNQTAVIL